jgi:transcription termination/antitermination protein NusG
MKRDAPRWDVPFSRGERVKIVNRPFTDFTGVVDEVDAETGKVRLLVSLFGHPTPVELDYLEITRVS